MSLLCLFREDYDDRKYLLFDWYPGVLNLIPCFSSEFNSISVVTNKPTVPTVRMLEYSNIDSYFSSVIGIDYPNIAFSSKPFQHKSQAIDYLINSRDLLAHECFYIGDTPADQTSALSSGIGFVASTYGFHKWNDNNLPLFHISGFHELLSVFKSINKSLP